MGKSYFEKLEDPRWQKIKSRVQERDHFICQYCGDDETSIHVHHMAYGKGEPWEIDINLLQCLCKVCHKKITSFQKILKEENITVSLEHWENICTFSSFAGDDIDPSSIHRLKYLHENMDGFWEIIEILSSGLGCGQ